MKLGSLALLFLIPALSTVAHTAYDDTKDVQDCVDDLYQIVGVNYASEVCKKYSVTKATFGPDQKPGNLMIACGKQFHGYEGGFTSSSTFSKALEHCEAYTLEQLSCAVKYRNTVDWSVFSPSTWDTFDHAARVCRDHSEKLPVLPTPYNTCHLRLGNGAVDDEIPIHVKTSGDTEYKGSSTHTRGGLDNWHTDAFVVRITPDCQVTCVSGCENVRREYPGSTAEPPAPRGPSRLSVWVDALKEWKSSDSGSARSPRGQQSPQGERGERHRQSDGSLTVTLHDMALKDGECIQTAEWITGIYIKTGYITPPYFRARCEGNVLKTTLYIDACKGWDPKDGIGSPADAFRGAASPRLDFGHGTPKILFEYRRGLNHQEARRLEEIIKTIGDKKGVSALLSSGGGHEEELEGTEHLLQVYLEANEAPRRIHICNMQD